MDVLDQARTGSCFFEDASSLIPWPLRLGSCDKWNSNAKQRRATRRRVKRCNARQCRSARQCKAMQSNAKQCKAVQSKAMQSNAIQCKVICFERQTRLLSLNPYPTLGHSKALSLIKNKFNLFNTDNKSIRKSKQIYCSLKKLNSLRISLVILGAS